MRASVPALHQLLLRLTPGDAIANHALWIRDCLRGFGYQSDIYAEFVAPSLAGEARPLIEGAPPAGTGLIYHHCIGTVLTDLVARHSGPKTIIYHNITPPEFFDPYNPIMAGHLRDGRNGLPALAADYEVAYGDSAYNVEELRAAGFKDCRVLPIPVFPDRWREPPDAQLMADLGDGLKNLLFVGRMAPNKAQHHLVEAFHHYLRMDPRARLIVAGSADLNDPYFRMVQGRVEALGLRGRVILFGHLTEAKLHALYQSADLFWSMSEHEGVCLPLIEAMWFDIPVLAFKSTAIPETLGSAGLMFDDKSDPASVAALAKLMVHDEALRSTVLAAQARRRQDFLPEALMPRFLAMAEALVPRDATG
jgi:glycosyltransferase involved in cell wall biosynthesis